MNRTGLIVALSAALLLAASWVFLTSCSQMPGPPGLTRAYAPPAAQARAMLEVQLVEREFNTEAYDHICENPFQLVAEHPLSTFSIDVDTASYSNVRRFLQDGQLPPPDAVRIEELVNYFPYDYAPPSDSRPFAVDVRLAACPWRPGHRLARIALKGREVPSSQRPRANLVFLLDVSGSMADARKLPLVRSAMKLLVGNLNEEDRIAIAVYAGASGLVLPSTPCSQRQKVLEALDALEAGGSTNGGAGIELAYGVASANLIRDGINRVILCTDGDFNVGVTNQGDLVRLIERKARSSVFLSVLGFGMGNLKDSTMEKLADKGNGNYAYIDTMEEARKVLGEQMGGTLITIAKDVKIQVEFNPAHVAAYRLIGYENRLLRKEDFNDDTKDAGEIGAGHTVTALYELAPVGQPVDVPAVDPLKYQTPPAPAPAAGGGEWMTVKLRYKDPDADVSQKIELAVRDEGGAFEQAPADLRFASAVAAFGMILRDSKYKGEFSLDRVIEVASSARGADPQGYRAEFVKLAETARKLRAGETPRGL